MFNGLKTTNKEALNTICMNNLNNKKNGYRILMNEGREHEKYLEVRMIKLRCLDIGFVML